ncbi:L-lactate dehydrogenase (quinone) large subunit LdhH [Desulfosoma caldarium]|uniref:Iron-sulfur cluster protein n=1 Tax=Desulfosoma caldarium TaxID=610254 RepID=A0A3N1VPF1_9BACT|nr:LUD domain-containing protein [Desulfosoma caldarium]ROR02898.1 iron-sulfur cluster protein [Desulfosoma caldarium]
MTTQATSSMKTYRQQLRRALDNTFLRQTLDTFAAAYRESRVKAFEGIDVESLVDDIARRKASALPHLEELFAQFKQHAEAAGAVVHSAKTAQEANDLIAAIAREHGVHKIIKSKSMTAEETFLNAHLEQEGFHVTETDLGEWIIQLRREGPSHMVLPAIHLSRHQVAELFEKVTGEKQNPDDIEKMVKVARRTLRRAYLEADMGISGANFAVAESGTLGLVTNEGNARLVTTLPRVHVALVGYDKLVPDLETALTILKALPRNATGQIISTYVTWITGATDCGSSPTGRKILHIIFLDNGRLHLAKHPVFSQALQCVRCGACANVCPIYRLVGGHNYGHVYIGAIGLILTAFYHGVPNARALVMNCLNCQACKAVCPAGIDLPYLIKRTVGHVLEAEKRRPVKNRLLNVVLKDRRLFHFLLRRAFLAQKPLAGKEPLIRHLPLFFDKAHGFRSLPVISATPLRDRWPGIKPYVANPALRVTLFGGCLIDFVYPEQAQAILPLLADHRVAVDYPQAQTCCGLPALMAAEEETARHVALQNLEAVDLDHTDWILTLCASCGSHMKENYPKLLGHDPALADRVQRFTAKIIDFSSFVQDVLKVSKDEFLEGGVKTAYHAPCHLCRGLKVVDTPRELLKTAGLDYVPTRDEDVCCGFGGSYSLEFPEISAELLRRKLDNVEASGAHMLVTDCPGCVLQLRGGADKQGRPFEVCHMAEAVARTYRRAKRISAEKHG